MKLACSSAAFARELAAGELTQTEWLDLCAHDLRVDGVVCDVRHFPRTDAEYLAQVKKTAVDVGLAIAGVAIDDAFGDDVAGDAALEIARAIGAPLLLTATPAASEDPAAWNALALAAARRTGTAKRVNVTLAVAPRAGRVCADVADLKRLAKDADSAWFRYAPDLDELATIAARAGVLAKSVMLTLRAETALAGADAAFANAEWFAGYVVLAPYAALDRAQIDAANERGLRALARAASETVVRA